MATTADQARDYHGPAVLSYGFRPFFLAAAAWAAISIALWLPLRAGHLSLPTLFAPLEWHVHELLYGYVPAVVAGFLLTAVPNWTGRPPITGAPLLALFLLWLAGRLAILFSEVLGPGMSAAVDLAFLAALGAVIAREIIAGGNWRNLKIMLIFALLLIGNAAFHLEVGLGREPGIGSRIGIAATVLLIMLIGGRIIPSFTQNWLAKRGLGRLPKPFGQFDGIAIAVSGAALAIWIAAPDLYVTAGAAMIAAAFNARRLARWAGERTTAEPLVMVLHAAFAFVPLGFVLVALAITLPDIVAPSGALHAWTVGAIGLMTLAVMTRASLGHTGRPLTATPTIQAIYWAAGIAAIARIAATLDLLPSLMLQVSAIAWVLAFAGFAFGFAPLLLGARR